MMFGPNWPNRFIHPFFFPSLLTDSPNHLVFFFSHRFTHSGSFLLFPIHKKKKKKKGNIATDRHFHFYPRAQNTFPCQKVKGGQQATAPNPYSSIPLTISVLVFFPFSNITKKKKKTFSFSLSKSYMRNRDHWWLLLLSRAPAKNPISKPADPSLFLGQ